MSWVCRQSASTIVLSDSMRQQLIHDLGQTHTDCGPSTTGLLKRPLLHPAPLTRSPQNTAFNIASPFNIQGISGRLHDLNTLLDTARILLSHPVQFVFIGGGAKQSQIDASCETNALTNILRLPYQPRATLPYSLGACDLAAVSLMPGAENSMAPCKFYGILASGRGVVLVCQTDLRSSPESCSTKALVVRGGKPGESEALAKELLQLSKDPDRVQAMGDRG